MDKAEFYRNARRDLTGPLHGIRVLDVTTSWAGPMCSCILADLGADVIKIEAPTGEVARRVPPMLPGTNPPVSFLQATVNRNKRSLTLQLRKPEGRDIFFKLAKTADVIVQNFRPGTLDKWGVGYEGVRAVKPDIVYVSISGFGQWGPIHDRVAYDPLAQAMGGFMSLNGARDGHPSKAPTFLCDDLGGLHGAIGALAALRHRDQTGEGQHVDVAMLDAMLFQSNGYLSLGKLGLPLERYGNEFWFSIPTNTYQCRDGQTVMAGVLLDTHWKVLAKMLGHPELADDEGFATMAGRMRNRDRCNELWSAWFAAHTVHEAVEECAQAGIPCAKVRTYAEAAEDPNTIERDMLLDVPQQEGASLPITGPAAKFSRTPITIRTGAPALGADNDDLLRDLGIDAATAKRLRDEGVI